MGKCGDEVSTYTLHAAFVEIVVDQNVILYRCVFVGGGAVAEGAKRALISIDR